MRTLKRILWSLVLVVIALAAGLAYLNRNWIMDWWKGLSYEPSSGMVQIRDALQLTGEGEFLFKAVHPSLEERDGFNAICRDDDTEIAVLGCYTEGNVHVYNIESTELDGIREVTTAHELLHAVWERMSDGDKTALNDELNEVLTRNRDFLDEELNNYDAAERQEELFVRAGTEVADLPAELERFYERIFKDQDVIAGFYNKYISVFRSIEAEMAEIEVKLQELDDRISNTTTEYEERVARLDANITLFNDCAEMAGCFVSEGDFYSKRAVLVAEQEALDAMYDSINAMVDEYNGLIEKYNSDVTHTEQLNRIINSAAKPEVVE